MNTVHRFLALVAPVLFTLSSFAAPVASSTKRCPELTSINTHNSLVNNNECAIILYHAPWCSACKVLDEPLEMAAQNNYKVKFAKINADGNSMEQLRKKLNIRSYPTLIGYRNGQIVEKIEGSAEKQEQNLQEINKLARRIQQPQEQVTPEPIKPQAKKPVQTQTPSIKKPAKKQQRVAPAA